MVILADELLEGFFGNDLAASFQLDKTEDEDYHQTQQKSEGILGGLMNLVVTNEWVALYHLSRTRLIAGTRTDSIDSPTDSVRH